MSTQITPLKNGPLQVDSDADMEIKNESGEVEKVVKHCHLCRCGHSHTKPFCDGTHAKIGFDSSK